jgi:hypothetical protein
MWDYINPEDFYDPSSQEASLPHGARVSRHGTVSFTRSGFAKVRWDDGTSTTEWAADLVTGDD